MAMTRILVVEDEPDLRSGLVKNLGREGYEVLEARDGAQAVKVALRDNPHLILLDVMLPEKNGLDVCRELRALGVEVPIIMLTAKSEEVDRVVGLEIGADDYVTKPFSLRELVARIRVQLRRNDGVAKEVLDHITFGNVEIDFRGRRAFVDGTELELSTREYGILKCLIRHEGEVVPRDRMLDEVWGYDAYPSTRTVDTHILKLRKKIESDPSHPKHIVSMYGEGYKFAR